MSDSEILMPRLSDSMDEATILAWLKQVGDDILVGEAIVEIETDKATMVYESEVEGPLGEILTSAGATVAVGEPIARIGKPGAAGASLAGGPRDSTLPAAGEAETAARGEERIKVSPLARRIARELGVDLSGLRGSGPGGRIRSADVEAAAGNSSVSGSSKLTVETAKGSVEVVAPTRLQTVVARRMSEAKATAPDFTVQAEIDMSAAVEARQQIKALQDPDGAAIPSLNDMVVKAAALALKKFPKANGAFREGMFELYSRINIGIAVAADDALVVPTVFDADSKDLRAISADTRELAAKVREGTITPPELSGGTFSVSNLGMFGVSSFNAVINPPQAAILALGEIEERPVVRSGAIVVARMMSATLSCDHRILYGSDGAEFMTYLRSLLEAPVVLAM